jgi:hypothetical protein
MGPVVMGFVFGIDILRKTCRLSWTAVIIFWCMRVEVVLYDYSSHQAGDSGQSGMATDPETCYVNQVYMC